MELAVLNTQGKETGRKVVLSDAVFGVEANDHAIYLDVKQYLADQRQGTHKSKQRNEVAGSTRKLKRQKGTGGARCGSIKSPLFVGGGRVFGPVPRDYSFKLNKKLKQLARRSALTYKAQAGAICVVEPISMDAPKTKSIVAMAEALKVADKKVLLLELGVGEMTPSIIKLPFWELTAKNENVFYACLNREAAHSPEHLRGRSLYLQGDLAETLAALRQERSIAATIK